MQNILWNLYKQGKNIALYTDRSNTSKFTYGRVLYMNDTDFALSMISPNGEYDGILVKSIDEILCLEVDSQYAQRMEKLCAEHTSFKLDISFDSENAKRDVLLDSMNSKKIVALELLHSGFDDVVGIAEKIDESVCQIKQIDSDGIEDGYVYVDIDCITQISYDSQDERRILRLYLINQNNVNK